ncbi:MAG TPA: hypothetical protein VF008_19065 [Niastella sp.]
MSLFICEIPILVDFNYYHALLGYLYANLDMDKAQVHYSKAIALTNSVTEKKTLEKAMADLSKA